VHAHPRGAGAFAPGLCAELGEGHGELPGILSCVVRVLGLCSPRRVADGRRRDVCGLWVEHGGIRWQVDGGRVQTCGVARRGRHVRVAQDEEPLARHVLVPVFHWIELARHQDGVTQVHVRDGATVHCGQHGAALAAGGNAHCTQGVRCVSDEQVHDPGALHASGVVVTY
jgi:hypothetical protein